MTIIPAATLVWAVVFSLRDDGTVNSYRTHVIGWEVDEEELHIGGAPVLAEGVDEDNELAFVEMENRYTCWGHGTFASLAKARASAVLHFKRVLEERKGRGREHA